MTAVLSPAEPAAASVTIAPAPAAQPVPTAAVPATTAPAVLVRRLVPRGERALCLPCRAARPAWTPNCQRCADIAADIAEDARFTRLLDL